MKLYAKTLVLILCSIAAYSGRLYSQIQVQDSLALIDFYKATKGNNWSNHTNWLSTNPVSTWYGITVKDNRVEKISFEYGNNVADTIPSSFGKLTGLKELNLNYNYVSALPEELGTLVNLQKLSLRNNQLSRIPSGMTLLSSLIELDLSGNYLAQLPDSLGKLTGLRSLNLENNKLVDFPSSYERLVNLNSLNLGGNKFSSIPLHLNSLKSLKSLNIGSNPLTTIPVELTSIDSLTDLRIPGCIIQAIPDEIGNMKSLKNLQLQGNYINQIPSTIQNLANLEELNLDNNRLTTVVPEIGLLKNLKILSLKSNRIKVLPASIGQLINLTELRLQYNKLVSVPAEMGGLKELTHLFLDNNELTDSLPGQLGNLRNLVYLSLHQNNLRGSIPSELGHLPRLKWIYLEKNHLDTLPDLSGDSSLIVVTAYNNHLTFSSIEPVLKLHNVSFYYSPQDSVGLLKDTTLNKKEKLRLSVYVGGTSNVYQWYKNGIAISGADSAVFTLFPGDSSAAGSYNCMITNRLVPDLILYSRPTNVTFNSLVGVGRGMVDVPMVFELHQNYPNPFNPSTTIKYDLPLEGRVVIKIYSISGAEITSLVDEVQAAGHKSVKWDGKDNHGKSVSSGIYLYKLQTGNEVRTRKMILLK
ncbi:MAG: T9SS type A sorting domain-containing protein [Ignavibacteriales bacterium]